MMTGMVLLFPKLLNMSITAGWLILAVILLRALFRKMPKSFRMALWVLVAIRLVCPFSIESAFSLIPSANTIQVPENISENFNIDSGILTLDQMLLNPVMQDSLEFQEYESANPALVWSEIAGWVWLAGILALAVYSLVSFLRLRRRVASGIRVDGNVWMCDEIDSPFILGFLCPRIYLPSGITDRQQDYVLRHEKIHLKRKDYIWKLLGFCILAVYWFHPLVWIAYLLFCRDVELACDEQVIRSMDLDNRKEYSKALLSLSVKRYGVAACPLFFGEVGVKERIKQVLNYKKPTFWVILVSVVTVVVVVVCFMTQRGSEEHSSFGGQQVGSGGQPQDSQVTEIYHDNSHDSSHEIYHDNSHDSNHESNHEGNHENSHTVNHGSIDFETVKEHLACFSEDADELEKAGCFVITYRGAAGVAAWNQFSTAVSAGNPAELVIAQYTVEGDVILDYLHYDGTEFYHVCDSSRDKFAGNGERYYEECFPFLKVFDRTGENGDRSKLVVLTDVRDLTYEDIDVIYNSESYDWENPTIRTIAYITTGNEHAETTGNEVWHEAAYSFDTSTVLIPREDICSIKVTNGNTGSQITFSVLDSSTEFREILDLYENLNVMPNPEMQHRIGYGYCMRLYNEAGELLQTVTPYKDALTLDSDMYEGSLNGTTTQLLLKLDALDWSAAEDE